MTATADRQSEFVELYRAGLKSSLEFWRSSLEGVERFQNQQLVDFIELQGKLAEAQLQGMMGYQRAALAQARAWLNEAAASSRS